MESIEDDYMDFPVMEFKNEKELQKEIEEILEITKDIQTDWKKREAAIKKIGGIILSNMGTHVNFIKVFNQKLYLNLSIQMVDLRSSLMKEACRIIILAARTYKEAIESALEKLFSPLVLYKLIGTQNRVISETGANCTMEIIKNVESVKIINKIHEQTKNKSAAVKLRLSQEMLYICGNYSKTTLSKVNTIVEDFIHSMTHDANMEVRQCARKVFFKYLEVFPGNANKLLGSFDNNVQKTILEEEDGNNSNNYNTNSNTGTNYSTTLSNTNTNNNTAPLFNNIQKSKTLSVSHHNTNSNNKPSHVSNKSGENFTRKTPETSPNKRGLSNTNNNTSSHVKVFSKTETKNVLNRVNKIYGGNTNTNTTGNNTSQSAVKSTKQQNKFTNITKAESTTLSNNNDEDNENQDHPPDQNRHYTTGNKYNTDNKPKFKNIEDLVKSKINNIIFLDKTEILVKIENFEQISSLFNEIYSNIDYISKTTLHNLILLHISNLAEVQPKLTIQIMKNLTKFIFYLDDIFSDEDIFKITKFVIILISSDNEQVSVSANNLFEIMRKKIESNLMIKPIMEIIDEETSPEILEITFEVMSPIIEVAVMTLSDQSNMNMLVKKIVKVLVKYENLLKFRILDIMEMIYRKYPKHFGISIGGLEEEQRNLVMKLLESYKKNLFEIIRNNTKVEVESGNGSNSSNFSKSSVNANNINTQINNLNLFEFEENFDISNVNFEILQIAAVNETQSMLNHFKSDPSENVENFLLALVKVNFQQVLPILTHIHNILNLDSDCELFLEHMQLLLNRVIFLLEKFGSEYADILREILLLIPMKLDKEIFLQLMPKYITPRQVPHIVQSLLISVKNVINSMDSESLLLLLPSFIETLFNTLTHHISDVRKLAVYCIVDIHFILGSDFDAYLNELNSSQRNLISIYIKKRKENK